jgi:hypothetical protein
MKNDRKIMKYVLGWTWEEAVVAYLKVVLAFA